MNQIPNEDLEISIDKGESKALTQRAGSLTKDKSKLALKRMMDNI